MKHILMLIMFMSLLLGKNWDYKFSGNINLTTELSNNTRLINGKELEHKLTTGEITFNNDIYYKDKTKISLSPTLNKTSNMTYNNVIKKEIPKIEMWAMNEAYITQKLLETNYGDLSISGGLFSFRKGTFYEHNYNGKRVGNGLFSNMDIMLQGIIVTHTYENNTLMIGDLRYERWMYTNHNVSNQDTVMSYRDYKDSGGIFIMDKLQLTDKIYTEFNYYGIDQYAIGKKMMSTDFFGLGLSYDDSEESGRTYYTILTYNKTKGNNQFLSPVLNWSINTPSTKFGSFENNGYSVLVGMKQELDQLVFDKDVVIGGEVIYKGKGYHSILAGNPFSPYSYCDIGLTYNLSAGIRLDKDKLVKLRYTKYEPNGSTKYGLSNDYTDSKNVPTSIDKSNQVVLEFYYDF